MKRETVIIHRITKKEAGVALNMRTNLNITTMVLKINLKKLHN